MSFDERVDLLAVRKIHWVLDFQGSNGCANPCKRASGLAPMSTRSEGWPAGKNCSSGALPTNFCGAGA